MAIKLPIRYEKTSNYIDMLKEVFCAAGLSYDRVCDRLIEPLELYYSGKAGEAYTTFKNAISEIMGESKLNFVTPINPGTKLYRARVQNDDVSDTFTKKEMFHIDFKDRTKVKNHRFSIAGLPCLYMSESVLACWLELGRPPLDKFTVTSLEVNDNEKEILCFDMCKLYSIFTSEDEHAHDKYSDFFKILIACSFVVQYPKDEFKPEYIIPQFIMQWLLDNDYNIYGIKYFTMCTDVDTSHSRIYTNYAFPARSMANFGVCEILSKMFTVKEPISGNMLQYAKKDSIQTVSHIKDLNNQEYYYITPGRRRTYLSSMYGLFEKVLSEDMTDLDEGDIVLSKND